MVRLTRAPERLRHPPARLAVPPKAADPFYLSRAWRAMAERLKRDRGIVCEGAGHEGPRACASVIADHVEEIRDGGARLDPANIMLLCPACHAVKTARMARLRAMSPI